MKIRLMGTDDKLVADHNIMPFVTLPQVIFWGLRTFVLYSSVHIDHGWIPLYRETFGFVIPEEVG